MPKITIKICGLSTPDMLEVALESGADMVGFVFHPRSPRCVTHVQAALLAQHVAGRARKVALVVDPSDQGVVEATAAIGADMLQLHGAARLTGEPPAETPERVGAMRRLAGRPVMKAIGVAEMADLDPVAAFADVADLILLDAKPPKDAAYPGGHGRTFDWSILSALNPATPFMLSGGLTPDNVGDAIRSMRRMGLNLAGVDVSSGVERAPGVKDAAKISDFIAAARAAAGESV